MQNFRIPLLKIHLHWALTSRYTVICLVLQGEPFSTGADKTSRCVGAQLTARSRNCTLIDIYSAQTDRDIIASRMHLIALLVCSVAGTLSPCIMPRQLEVSLEMGLWTEVFTENNENLFQSHSKPLSNKTPYKWQPNCLCDWKNCHLLSPRSGLYCWKAALTDASPVVSSCYIAVWAWHRCCLHAEKVARTRGGHGRQVESCKNKHTKIQKCQES